MNAATSPLTRRARPALVALAALLLAPLAVAGEADRTLSPYFFVPGGDSAADSLPLKSTSADVRIAGVIAEVRVSQVYRNEGKRALEAIYVFPASTRAAVHGMRMTIGDRVIEAVVEERGAARQTYESARAAGRTASLLEQQRPNVFQMSVANVLPGDEVKVDLAYTEMLVPEAGVYELVYPSVVGPRYAGAGSAEPWVANPHLRQGQPPSYAFAFKATIAAGMPIARVACPSHRTSVRYEGAGVAHVELDPAERDGGNRDVVLRYALAGQRVQSGLLLFEGAKESYFLLTVQPPARPLAAVVPPREVVFIVDISGSMHGFPLDVSKAMMRELLSGLGESDRFNLLLFAGSSTVLGERSLPATAANVRLAMQTLERQQGGGGTELVPALRRALALPREEGTSRTFLILTDGYVSVEREAFELIRQNLGQANLFAFGIGSSVNRFLIEGLARAGMGEPFVVTGAEQAAAEAERFRRYVSTPVLTGLRLEAEGVELSDLEPATLPDVFAERPVVVIGKWKGPGRGRLVLRGSNGDGPFRHVAELRRSASSDANAALRQLWARQRIQRLADFNRLAPDAARVREVTALGLEYNLLTEYTSFVAVDQRARRQGEGYDSVRQPLPLPQGVSDLAIGAPMPAAAPQTAYAYKAVPVEGAIAMREDRVIGGLPGGVTAGERPPSSGAGERDRGVRREAGGGTSQPAVLAADAARCLERQARRLTFPAAAGGSVVFVELELSGTTIAFKRAEVRDGGALTVAEVTAVARAAVARWTACSKDEGGLARVVLALEVDAAGRVASAQVV